jgi:hypothetical protein
MKGYKNLQNITLLLNILGLLCFQTFYNGNCHCGIRLQRSNTINKVLHWIQSWATSFHLTSQPTSLITILILASYLLLRLPIGCFPTGIPTRISCVFLIQPIWDIHPINHSLLDFTLKKLKDLYKSQNWYGLHCTSTEAHQHHTKKLILSTK